VTRYVKKTAKTAHVLATCIGFALTACATPEPRIVTRTVSVPIATPCAVSPGPEPAPIWTPEAIAASPNLYTLGMLLYSEMLQQQARNGELRAALSGCR
jgi:hypothetical protein